MAETLLCFTAGERLLTMGDQGQAVIWQVQANGELHAMAGLAPGKHHHLWIGEGNDRHCKDCGSYG